MIRHTVTAIPRIPSAPACPRCHRALSTAARAFRYQPQMHNQPQPSRAAILVTYRKLLRLAQKSANGQGQLFVKERQARWDTGADRDGDRDHGTGIAMFQYDSKWVSMIRTEYRAHQSLSDPLAVQAAHLDAVEYVSLLASNIEHSRAVFEAGWGLKQDTKAQIANVARRVGLEVTKSTLENEIASEPQSTVPVLGEDAVEDRIHSTKQATRRQPIDTYQQSQSQGQ